MAGVAVNKIGQYIIADRYNHRIQIFDATGHFIRAFGSQGTVDGKFSYPWGITTDNLGLIYVCDKENHRVQVNFYVKSNDKKKNLNYISFFFRYSNQTVHSLANLGPWEVNRVIWNILIT